MAWFSKKEDTKHIKHFDYALNNVVKLADRFRTIHFSTLEVFENNFKKEKKEGDLQKERVLFESHMDMLHQLKLEVDNMMSEAHKIVSNETQLTQKDRDALKKIMQKKDNTNIKVSKK